MDDTLNIGTRATLIYLAMTLLGIIVVTLSTIYPNFSLNLTHYNASSLLFNVGPLLA